MGQELPEDISKFRMLIMSSWTDAIYSGDRLELPRHLSWGPACPLLLSFG